MKEAAVQERPSAEKVTPAPAEAVSLYQASKETGIPSTTLARWVREGRLCALGERRRGRRTVTYVAREDVLAAAAIRQLAVETRTARSRIIVKLYEAGLSTPAIGRRLGVHFSTVNDDLRRAGIALRPAGPLRLPVRRCEGCGRAFQPRSRDQRFHSHGCYAASLKKYGQPAERECEACGRRFTPDAWLVARGGGRHCSVSCARGGPARRAAAHSLLADAWSRGSGLAAAAIGRAGGRARQRWLGRWKGREHGSKGGRPRVEVADEQRSEILRLNAAGWGRRGIAARLQVSERAVRNLLAS